MEKSVGGSNKELSKLCLAGFILTIMPVLLLPLCLIFPREYGVVSALAIILLMPLTGLIISIVGLITAGKKGKTGKSYAYDYASTEDIAGVDIYMIDMDSYQEY